MKSSVQQSVPAWRFRVMASLLLLLAALLSWRVLSLQVLDTERGYRFLQSQGDMRTVATIEVPAHRGMITDRHGEPLAVSTPVVTLWADPRILANHSDQVARLAKGINADAADLKRKLESYRGKAFMYLRRHMSPDRAGQVLALEIPGVYGRDEYRRFYPAGEVAAHVLGLTNIDDHGQEGVELAYDEWLAGSVGSKRVLRDRLGRPIRDVDSGEPARPGKDLVLSIDLRLQYLAYRELKTAKKRAGAKAGSVVLLDIQSGEVLAMVNQPSFNPNNRRSLKPASLRNRAVTDLFEPGSTVKPLTVLAALESGDYRPDTKINTNPGYLRVGRKTLVDPVNYGVLDVTGVLKKSSQVGTSRIALSLNEQSVWEMFSRLGLGQATGVGFPGEGAGVLPNRTEWKPIERVNFAFGYGLSVTALQLARAYSVIGGEGLQRDLTILRRDEEPAAEQLVDRRLAKQLVKMLEEVTEHGTGRSAQVEGYRVAGKTGTVHKAIKGGYADEHYLALFAGIAPSTNPRIAAVVMVDDPSNGKYYGGEVAAPIFGQVIGGALRLLHIAPDKTLTADTSSAKPGAV